MEQRIFPVIFLTIACGIAWVIWLAISRALQVHQLMQDGTETNGRVLLQYEHWIKMPMTSGYYLHYSYIDRTGITHECKRMVPHELWTAHPDGNPIAVIYSKSKPEISLPRALMEKARAMVGKKKDRANF